MTEYKLYAYDEVSKVMRRGDLQQALYEGAGGRTGRRNLLNLHGEEHRARRMQEIKVFRKDFFQFYEQNVLVPELEATLQPFVDAGGCDLVELGFRLMLNLTADFTGIDRPKRTAEETGELLRLLRTFGLTPGLTQTKLTDTSQIMKAFYEAMEEFDRDWVEPSLRRRTEMLEAVAAGRLAESDLPRDILTVILQGQDQLKMSRDEILEEAAFFLLAGAHTSVQTLSHVMHEIFDWLDANPGRENEVLDDPFFVQRAVHEALRLHPVSPIAKRKALCPMHIEEIGDVTPQDDIVLSLHDANRDVSIFGEDSQAFCPHREAPAGTTTVGLSMGVGPHACLGRNLAIGTDPKRGADPATHHYGTVPQIVTALLKAGIRRNPAEAAVRDPTTERNIWERYPVLFGGA